MGNRKKKALLVLLFVHTSSPLLHKQLFFLCCRQWAHVCSMNAVLHTMPYRYKHRLHMRKITMQCPARTLNHTRPIYDWYEPWTIHGQYTTSTNLEPYTVNIRQVRIAAQVTGHTRRTVWPCIHHRHHVVVTVGLSGIQCRGGDRRYNNT